MASSSSNLQDYMQRESERLSGSADASNLPANQNTILKLLSEPKEMPYKELCKAVEQLPETTRLTQSQLDGTLYELIRMGYLTSFMEKGDVVYLLQVELGTKAPAPRHEQKLVHKFNFKDLDLDQLSNLSDDETNS